MAIRNDDFEDNIESLFDTPNGISDNQSNIMWNNTQGQMQYDTQSQMNYNTQEGMQYNTQTQMPFGTQNQGYEDNYENYYQQPQNYMEQNQQYYSEQNQNNKPNKRQEFFGNLADKDIKLGNKSTAVLIGVVGIIIVLVVSGLFTLANRPKTQKVIKQVPKTVTTTTNTQHTQDTDNIKLTIVDDSVSIDYSAAILENTGLVTGKNKYLLNGQLVYSLSISMAVGNEQKEIEHFCNYNTYKSIETGTVLGVKYQQVADTVLTVCDITK